MEAFIYIKMYNKKTTNLQVNSSIWKINKWIVLKRKTWHNRMTIYKILYTFNTLEWNKIKAFLFTPYRMKKHTNINNIYVCKL